VVVPHHAGRRRLVCVPRHALALDRSAPLEMRDARERSCECSFPVSLADKSGNVIRQIVTNATRSFPDAANQEVLFNRTAFVAAAPDNAWASSIGSYYISPAGGDIIFAVNQTYRFVCAASCALYTTHDAHDTHTRHTARARYAGGGTPTLPISTSTASAPRRPHCSMTRTAA
jgi:hypothetical protein